MTEAELMLICQIFRNSIPEYEKGALNIWSLQMATGLRATEALTFDSLITMSNSTTYVIQTLKGSGLRVINRSDADPFLFYPDGSVNPYVRTLSYHNYRRVLLRAMSGRVLATDNKMCVSHLPRHVYAKRLAMNGATVQDIAANMAVRVKTANHYVTSELRFVVDYGFSTSL